MTKDVEIRTEGNDKKSWEVAYFTIAVQDDFNYKKADFINCKSPQKDIKYLKAHGKKGVWVEVKGRTKTYTKDDNHNQYTAVDKVNIIFANSKKETQKTTEEEILGEPPVF